VLDLACHSVPSSRYSFVEVALCTSVPSIVPSHAALIMFSTKRCMSLQFDCVLASCDSRKLEVNISLSGVFTLIGGYICVFLPWGSFSAVVGSAVMLDTILREGISSSFPLYNALELRFSRTHGPFACRIRHCHRRFTVINVDQYNRGHRTRNCCRLSVYDTVLSFIQRCCRVVGGERSRLSDSTLPLA
jgi:hypothetical protein